MTTVAWWMWLLSILLEVVGIALAVRAILIARTPQSAIGWSVGLVLVPIITIPLFLVFGESRFSGYSRAGLGIIPALDTALVQIAQHLNGYRAAITGLCIDGARVAENLSHLAATRGNAVRLLVDGEATFGAIFEAIKSAKETVWVQFFIIRDDGLGKELARHLIEASERGVACRVLYDPVGSKGLPAAWSARLRSRGVQVCAFITNRQFGRRFQINFRNHRKLVMVDGRIAFLGGLNVGDEYMGLSKKFGPWRDTHLRVEGPAAAGFQMSFLEDWNYASGEVPGFSLQNASPVPSANALVFPVDCSPADAWSVCPAVFLSVIQDAQHRLWFASPYFVPSGPLLYAICHAALRGVDVRILLPAMADHTLPWLSAFTFYPKIRAAGVKVFRYQPGFMHQKVLLADDDFSIVGSINLDYRSFMLNFELSAAVQCSVLAKEVEAMLRADFERSLPEDLWVFEKGSWLFRLKCRAAALLSPEQ